MSNSSATKMGNAEVRELLHEIGNEFAREGRFAEVALYGGAALLLLFNNRASTRDIDFMPVESSPSEIIAVANRVGARHGLEENWFNDSVRMFSSSEPDYMFFGDFPPGGEGGLRVFTASPRYILAMKMMAMRSSLETSDVFDTWNLIDACGIKDLQEAEKFVAKFFPGDELPQRNRELLTQIFEDKQAGKTYDAMNYW